MNVKRRGISVADLGEKIDSSVEGGIRPVLVLQNDKGNEHSTTVIIAPITSKLTKHRIPKIGNWGLKETRKNLLT